MNPTEKPKKTLEAADDLPDAEADERFRRAIETALATPPKHHKDEPRKRENR